MQHTLCLNPVLSRFRWRPESAKPTHPVYARYNLNLQKEMSNHDTYAQNLSSFVCVGITFRKQARKQDTRGHHLASL